MSKFESLLMEMQKAIQRLEDALKRPKDEFIRDSAIQRFEFCFGTVAEWHYCQKFASSA